MNIFSIFSRQKSVRPATMEVHTDFPNGPCPLFVDRRGRADVIERRGELPPSKPADYAPKRKPIDPTEAFLMSLSRNERLKLCRLLRHGYRLGPVVEAPNVFQFKRAA